MDGTLVGSGELHWIAWRITMANEGIRHRTRAISFYIWPVMIRLSPPGLAPRRVPSKSNESRKQTEELYRHLVSRIGIAHEPGVARRLRRLHKRGWQQAIASAAPRANIDAVLEALSASHIFQSIVSAEDVHRGKPDPEVYLLAASRVGVAAERSIVVEDASAGIEGGRRTGMRTLG
jgi:HAD superfamily hydrolase (TIGR01509 family)